MEAKDYGVGARLKYYLSKIGIKEKIGSGCNCNELAYRLDLKGPEWCEEHFDDIIDELYKRSVKYDYPFYKPGAVAILKLAISRTKSAQNGV